MSLVGGEGLVGWVFSPSPCWSEGKWVCSSPRRLPAASSSWPGSAHTQSHTRCVCPQRAQRGATVPGVRAWGTSHPLPSSSTGRGRVCLGEEAQPGIEKSLVWLGSDCHHYLSGNRMRTSSKKANLNINKKFKRIILSPVFHFKRDWCEENIVSVVYIFLHIITTKCLWKSPVCADHRQLQK